MKKILKLSILSILFLAIYFQGNNLRADEKLMHVTLLCGKSAGGKRAYASSFYASVTEHTFQGSRFWTGTPPRYKATDTGYEIFTGFKTKDRFVISVKGKYVSHADKWSYSLKSKGDLSIKEHLKKGVKGTRGDSDWKRKCEVTFIQDVNAPQAMTIKNLSKRFNKTTKENDKLNNDLKNIKEEKAKLDNQINSLNSSLGVSSALSQSTLELIFKALIISFLISFIFSFFTKIKAEQVQTISFLLI